jgi:hypothetical protein
MAFGRRRMWQARRVYPGMVPHRQREPEYSYAVLIARAQRDALLAALTAAGFSGWVGPPEGDWVVLVARRVRKAVTARGHDLEALGAHLAARLDAVVFAAHVLRDRVLRLAAWVGEEALGRYLSDPSYGAEDDDEAFPEPEGVEHAAAFAAAAGRPDTAEELEETLGELLDEEEQTESERLWAVLKLLGLPLWPVASSVLPKDVPGGPLRGDVTLLFRGRTGPAAAAATRVTDRDRRRKG